MARSTVTPPRPGRQAERPAEAWHALAPAEVIARLGGEPNGLSAAEAAARLDLHGPNRLPHGARQSAIARLAAQVHNLLIYVLLASAAISAAIGHPTDALVILGVVVANAVIGFVQEGRAERSLDAIRAMVDPTASVLRDGHRVTLPAEDVVPGDVVLLEAGDRVPADLRLTSAHALRIDEAVLTGESVPVDKDVAAVATEAALGDRTDMAFSGTFVTAGQGAGVVVATAGDTELGRVGAMIGAVERLTSPLVREMDHFARQVTTVVLVASVAVFAYAVGVAGHPMGDAFMAVVGIAVAAIPEGLPAVLTITLAVGVRRMARRNAIVRRLPAVETLGAVSIICSDKTGTLTRNEMTVRALVTGGREIAVEGAGYAPLGGFLEGEAAVDPAADRALEELALAGLLCNDADIRERAGAWVVDGDPMEGALVTLAAKAGHDARAARERFARIGAIPFDSRHRTMAVLVERGADGPVAYLKGAPEAILAASALEATADGAAPIDLDRWERAVERLAAEGLRVLALARRRLPAGTEVLAPHDVAAGCTLLGLVGLIDPPRAEAVAAIEECTAAGIRIKMITGDHAATARAIARRLGLGEEPRTVTGRELDGADDAAFRRLAAEATVFARTSPEHKLRLVEALQAAGAVVAMTGDGVNDAPALKRADVGVAMGGKGTEAAKEASEMVLADDNFASIVAAVREGRTVYDNLTKVIAWTLPTNGGEAAAIVLAILFGAALPVTPVQILWINMVTAVALGLTLAFEPTEPGAMRRRARTVGRGFLSARLVWQIALVTALMVAGTFGTQAFALARGHGPELARTMVVNAIVTMEIFYLFSVRFAHGPSLTWRGVVGTPAVLVGVAGTVAAQLAFTYAPPFNAAFGSRPVPLADGLAVVAVGAVLFVAVEVEKLLAARLGRRGAPARAGTPRRRT